MMRTAEFIQVLPKAELHLHLEGAVPWAMARAFSANSLPERPAWYTEGFQFTDFLQFRGAVRDCMNTGPGIGIGTRKATIDVVGSMTTAAITMPSTLPLAPRQR